MKLIGMMSVRNEAWCLGLSARVALMWCDELVIFLHACTDASRAIVYTISKDNPGRVHPMWTGGEWLEMEHRQAMLVEAREHGATHLAIIDADEIITGPGLLECAWDGYRRKIQDMVDGMPRGSILQLPGYNLRGSLNRYHQNGIWGNRWFSLAFADAEGLHWSGDRFHQREPMGRPLVNYRPIQQGQGGILHLWGASERRLRAKHAHYKLTEALRWPNKPLSEIDRMYNLWRDPRDSAVEYPSQTAWAQPWVFADVPASWIEPYSHLMKYLNIDAEPWQESECRRLVAEHGTERFAGLELFGVA